MERKKFFDVFPALKLNDNLQAMFEEVYVTRVSSNMSHDKLRVYIESSRLIEKSAIFTVRDEIIRNLRLGKRIGIEIVEKYHLSQQYTVENLLDAYKESIVMELGVRSPIVSTMFKKAPIRFDENKNPAKFIEIIKNIKKVKNDIMAGMLGIGKLEENIKKMIDEYELGDNVILYGYKDNPYPIINSTKIMCLTSYSEGFPTVLMEGMILGKPFISTEVAGTKEMSNSNKCGFVSNDNEMLCKYAIKLLEDKKLYDVMSRDSKKHAENFTLINQIKNIESIIDKE